VSELDRNVTERLVLVYGMVAYHSVFMLWVHSMGQNM
jgi:hypothetical protein